jgi:ribosomal protein S27AE
MGSVQDLIDCPKCDYKEAIYEVDYKKNREDIFCPKCGVSIIYEGEKKKQSGGKGAFEILSKERGGKIGSLTDKKSLEKYWKKLSDKEKGNIDRYWYSFKKNGKWFVKDLISNTTCEWKFNEIIDKIIGK